MCWAGYTCVWVLRFFAVEQVQDVHRLFVRKARPFPSCVAPLRVTVCCLFGCFLSRLCPGLGGRPRCIRVVLSHAGFAAVLMRRPGCSFSEEVGQ